MLTIVFGSKCLKEKRVLFAKLEYYCPRNYFGGLLSRPPPEGPPPGFLVGQPLLPFPIHFTSSIFVRNYLTIVYFLFSKTICADIADASLKRHDCTLTFYCNKHLLPKLVNSIFAFHSHFLGVVWQLWWSSYPFNQILTVYLLHH